MSTGVIPSPAAHTEHTLPWVTDKYFTRSRNTLEYSGMNPTVVYRCFMRVPAIAVHKFAKEYLAVALAGASYEYRELVAEGQLVDEKTPLFELEGKALDLVEIETPLLWHVGWPALCAYNARVLREQTDWPLLDMSARHCPGLKAQVMASYGAHLGGFNGCSTEAGSATFGGEPIGTIPHFLIGAFGSTVRATMAFHKAHPNVNCVALVDYYGKEITDSLECFRALGDKLWGIRLDTHGGRHCEGTINADTDEGRVAALHRLTDEFDIQFPGTYQHAVGRGVTLDAVFSVRKALDAAGAKDVRIVVSSGFTPGKTAEFVKANAPVGAVGTGSFLPTDIRDTYATLDAVSYDGVKSIKLGREWLLE